ncbi:UNVERIFIED_CONTAM: hypothetical protein ACS92_05895 [Bacillus cereus]
MKRLQWQMRKEGIELGIDEESYVRSEDEYESAVEDFGVEEPGSRPTEAEPEETEVTPRPVDSQPELEEVPSADSQSGPVPAFAHRGSVSPEVDDLLDEDERLAELERVLNGEENDDDWSTHKKGKKKKTRPKSSKPVSQPSTPSGEKCSVCKEKFPSRNKLFQHINATGHASAPKKKRR